MALNKTYTRRFKKRVKKASLPQLRNLLVLLSKRINRVKSVSGVKRLKAKIIITQMAIRNRMGSSPTTGNDGVWANQAGVWANQAGPQPLSPGITQSFISSMQDGYNKFGCKFLCNRIQIQKNMLYGLQSAGSNPNWQTLLLNRVQYIDSLLIKYGCNCSEIGQNAFDCKALQPYCNPLKNQTQAGNMAAVNGIMTNIASQYGVSIADVQAMFKKCCFDDGTSGGDTRYTCYDDGTCNPDPNGQYASLADCQKECGPRGSGTLDCERILPYCEQIDALVANNQSQQLQTLMNSLAQQFGVTYNDVKSAYLRCCKRTTGGRERYSCDKKTGQCYLDPNGPYTSLADCQRNCRPGISGSDRYSCDKKTGQCYPDPNGPRTTIWGYI